jgi:Phosphopantetheine attachment site
VAKEVCIRSLNPANNLLRFHLRLPGCDSSEYMVPAAYARFEALPLTNGKLDLPEPEAGAFAVSSYEAPVGEVETALAAIWADLLKIEQVGCHDKFFNLGGHPLPATKLLLRVYEILDTDITVHDIFSYPNLNLLANHLLASWRVTGNRSMAYKEAAPFSLTF